MKKLFGKKGFTLIEIVMVIVLLAIIAAFAYPKYIDLRDDAHKAADQGIIGSWRAGVHIYFAKNKTFPSSQTDLEGCLAEGLPAGWSIAAGSSPYEFRITCNGLPSDGTEQSWDYDADEGTFTLVTGGHGF